MRNPKLDEVRRYLDNRIKQILHLFEYYRIKEESKVGAILAAKVDAYHEVLIFLKTLEMEES